MTEQQPERRTDAEKAGSSEQEYGNLSVEDDPQGHRRPRGPGRHRRSRGRRRTREPLITVVAVVDSRRSSRPRSTSFLRTPRSRGATG